MAAPWLVTVGGFLGAGKTSLILAAGRALSRRGLRSAAILNDQGEDLVDTGLVGRSMPADQVSGGCFCCRFSDLLQAADRLAAHAPEVIFAEPVGSCTDLSATILQPLARDFPGRFRLAPLTVVIDPEFAGSPMSHDMAFLFRNQLAEADLICLSKCDLDIEAPDLPASVPVRFTSALTSEGVDAWLDEVLSGDLRAGNTTLNIDYDRYAQAEAAMSWLNRRVRLELVDALSPAAIAGPLLDGILEQLELRSVPVLHCKLLNTTESGYVKAAVTGSSREPVVEGQLDASPALHHDILLNLRSSGEPALVAEIVETEMARVLGVRISDTSASFRPLPPKPERRITI
jgi:hypothetical protein